MSDTIEERPENEEHEAPGGPGEGDSLEAFGARQADGLGLDCFYIEGDDGEFVPAREFLAEAKRRGDRREQ